MLQQNLLNFSDFATPVDNTWFVFRMKISKL